MTAIARGMEMRVPRLKRLTRDEVDAEQVAMFDALAGGPPPGAGKWYHGIGPDGGLEGPSNARLRSPIGRTDQEYGESLRRHTVLTDRMRELVVLTVAYAQNSAFELHAHEEIGRSVGLTDEQLSALAAAVLPDGLDQNESLAVRCARALVDGGDLDDPLYEEAITSLGERALYEIVLFVGYYSQLALQLRVFRVVPPG